MASMKARVAVDLAMFVLRLMPPVEGFSYDDLHKILHGGQNMA